MRAKLIRDELVDKPNGVTFGFSTKKCFDWTKSFLIKPGLDELISPRCNSVLKS